MLDEAEELFDRGFEDEIMDIIKLLEPNVQVIVSTSTVQEALNKFCTSVLKNPIAV